MIEVRLFAGLRQGRQKVYQMEPDSVKTVQDIMDVLNNTDQLVSYMVKIMTGDNADQTQDTNLIKDRLYKALSKHYLPMLDWVNAENAIKDAKITIEQEKLKSSVSNPGQNNDSY